MASRLFPGNSVTSFPPTKELVGSFTLEEGANGSWTVPFGITKIFATLIGGGGGLGGAIASATTNFSNVSVELSGGSNGYPTTITVNGTTYTALGGSKGKDASHYAVSAPYDEEFGYGNSSQTSQIQDGSFYSTYIGAGAGRGVQAYARATEYSGSEATARVIQQNGLNGETKKFEINVNPGNVVNYSVAYDVGENSVAGALYITY